VGAKRPQKKWHGSKMAQDQAVEESSLRTRHRSERELIGRSRRTDEQGVAVSNLYPRLLYTFPM